MKKGWQGSNPCQLFYHLMGPISAVVDGSNPLDQKLCRVKSVSTFHRVVIRSSVTSESLVKTQHRTHVPGVGAGAAPAGASVVGSAGGAGFGAGAGAGAGFAADVGAGVGLKTIGADVVYSG